MGDTLVLREIDSKESFADLAIYGAINSSQMETTWRALESIRMIAATLPDYYSGSHPSKAVPVFDDP